MNRNEKEKLNITVHATSRSGHFHFIESLKSWHNNLIIFNIENTIKIVNIDVSFLISFIFIRDYLNTLASMSKRNYKGVESAIQSWEYLCKSSLETTSITKIIKYEDFISSKSYRKSICSLIDGNYNEDQVDKLPYGSVQGGSYPESAFDGFAFEGNASKMDVNNRWKQLESDKIALNFFLKYIKKYPDTLKLYLDIYKPSQEKIDFLDKYNLLNI